MAPASLYLRHLAPLVLLPRRGILSDLSSRGVRLIILPPLLGMLEILLLFSGGVTVLSLRGSLKNLALLPAPLLTLFPLTGCIRSSRVIARFLGRVPAAMSPLV